MGAERVRVLICSPCGPVSLQEQRLARAARRSAPLVRGHSSPPGHSCERYIMGDNEENLDANASYSDADLSSLRALGVSDPLAALALATNGGSAKAAGSWLRGLSAEQRSASGNLFKRWRQAKRVRDYATADSIRAELRGMNVDLDASSPSWVPAGGGGLRGRGSKTSALSTWSSPASRQIKARRSFFSRLARCSR